MPLAAEFCTPQLIRERVLGLKVGGGGVSVRRRSAAAFFNDSREERGPSQQHTRKLEAAMLARSAIDMNLCCSMDKSLLYFAHALLASCARSCSKFLLVRQHTTTLEQTACTSWCR